MSPSSRAASEYKIRDARPEDAEGIAVIYNQGIEDRIATFETGTRTAEERLEWLAKHDVKHPVLVAVQADVDVLGWSAITAISDRPCYAGVGEYSVYVRRDARGRGVGTRLVEAIIERARAEGYWKLIGRMFTFNEVSRRVSQKFGFREVGVLQKHAKLDGRWVDVLEIERLIPENMQSRRERGGGAHARTSEAGAHQGPLPCTIDHLSDGPPLVSGKATEVRRSKDDRVDPADERPGPAASLNEADKGEDESPL